MMDESIRAGLREKLCLQANLPPGFHHKVMREWSLSAVERLYFPDGHAAVFKVAAEPFTGEAAVLSEVAARGVPVPTLYAHAIHAGLLGMVMEDLGEPVRAPGDRDAVEALVALHATGAIGHVLTLGPDELRRLPERAMRNLALLRRRGRWLGCDDIHTLLARLDDAAFPRSAGADLEPFGVCHSEFHPSSLHIGTKGWRLLDFARTFNGPGLLDLASWDGTVDAPDPEHLRGLIEDYVRAGGSHHAATSRGGLPAEKWALGWHRVWAVEWFIAQAVKWISEEQNDPTYITVVRRHLAEAVNLLEVR